MRGSLVWLLALLSTALAPRAESTTNAAPLDLLIAVSAPGESDFQSDIAEAAADWEKAAKAAGKSFRTIGAAGATNALEELRETLSLEGPIATPNEFWLVFIGHGTFDGREAKFNLPGPDLSATNLAVALHGFGRPIIAMATFSASAPFMKALSGTNRIVVTATKSGFEDNYSRFAKFLARSVIDPAADLDKDGQTSLLEAFLLACRGVTDFYDSENRLATEHALIDDNGDGLGTASTFFQGVRAVKAPEANRALDGLRAHQAHFRPNAEEARFTPEQRQQRNALELELEALRNRRATLSADEYFASLEQIVSQLSRLYLEAEAAAPKP